VASSGIDTARLARLGEIGRALVARLDLEGVLEVLLDAARELSGARSATLGILAEGKGELDRFLTLGVDGSRGLPPDHPPPPSSLGVPIRIRGATWGSLYLTEKGDGTDFDEGDEAALAALAEWAAIAVENARLYEGLARRRDQVELKRDEAEHAARALAVMTDIARSVGGETEVGRILGLIVDRGRSLVGARALLIMLAEGEELVTAATAGELEGDLRGARIQIAGTLPGEVLRGGRTERLGDGGATALLDLGVAAEAAILVPLTFRGASSGVLLALDREADGPGFGVEDERLLRSFAASAATAVATARSVEAERLRHSLEAAEQERKRWARELHDETLQALGGLRMLHSAALREDADGAEVREALRQGIELIDAEIDNLSALIAELRPAALDEIGLIPALRTLAQRKGREGGLTIEVLAHLEDEARLPAETENVLYRLVQEALNNVVKHAGAGRTEVALERVGELVAVTVADDGHGFDPAAAGGGFGLIGMRERVELAGGRLRIEPRPGQGTRVSASIPVAGAKRAHLSNRPLSST
jgi:signal transduction histidine kinase